MFVLFAKKMEFVYHVVHALSSENIPFFLLKFNYFDNICGIFGSFEDIYLYFDAILLKISNFASCKIVYNLYWRILLDFYTKILIKTIL